MTNSFDLLISQFFSFLFSAVISIICLIIVAFFLYMLFQWFKYRDREKYALDFVSLMIRLPKDNEIKIDAAEQMFASLFSLKKDGWFAWMKSEDLFSFEIVALQEEISFYVNCPRSIRDLVEKQIHGAYPGADIREKDEVNIFSEKGRVAFAQIGLEKASYFPIKTYKDLPTDGLSMITSAMSKMGPGEGSVLQIILQPENRRWQDKGYSYMQNEKKREADPEKASYKHDPKKMESIDNKISKPGFRVVIRIVVSSPSEHSAQSHLNNIVGAFCSVYFFDK